MANARNKILLFSELNSRWVPFDQWWNKETEQIAPHSMYGRFQENAKWIGKDILCAFFVHKKIVKWSILNNSDRQQVAFVAW